MRRHFWDEEVHVELAILKTETRIHVWSIIGICVLKFSVSVRLHGILVNAIW